MCVVIICVIQWNQAIMTLPLARGGLNREVHYDDLLLKLTMNHIKLEQFALLVLWLHLWGCSIAQVATLAEWSYYGGHIGEVSLRWLHYWDLESIRFAHVDNLWDPCLCRYIVVLARWWTGSANVSCTLACLVYSGWPHDCMISDGYWPAICFGTRCSCELSLYLLSKQEHGYVEYAYF